MITNDLDKINNELIQTNGRLNLSINATFNQTDSNLDSLPISIREQNFIQRQIITELNEISTRRWNQSEEKLKQRIEQLVIALIS
jgi:hypothetical protein